MKGSLLAMLLGVAIAVGSSFAAAQQSATEAGSKGSIWRRTCAVCRIPIVWFELLPDGTFRYRYGDEGLFVTTNARSTWSIDEGYLVLSWNNDFSVERFHLESGPVHAGTKSNVPGAKLELERKR